MAGLFLLVFLESRAPAPVRAQVGEAARVKRAFLAPEARSPQYLALISHPELFRDPQVRMKIFRSLGSKDLQEFQAAVELVMNAPELEEDPMIVRRFSGAFLSRDVEKQTAILEMAASEGYLEDLRVISLLAKALVDEAAPLSQAAVKIVQEHPGLQELPAIAEALLRRPEQWERASRVPLPDFEFFQAQVQPILEKPGEDDKSCVECHKTHVILTLEPIEEGKPREEQIRERYRAALRVIRPEQPEESLLVNKPTYPDLPRSALRQGEVRSHGGGERFSKGSAEYEKLLEWIRTAGR